MKQFKIIQIIILLLLSNSVFLFSQNLDVLFNQANNEYKNNAIDSAINNYEKILKLGYESPEVYFNLGNAYFKQKKNALAILNYERALRLNPSDDAINYNLDMSNSLLVDKINVLPEFFLSKWISSIRKLYNSDIWAIISISTFILFLLLIIIYLFSRIIWLKKITFWFGILCFLVSMFSIKASYDQKQDIVNHRSAIFMGAQVTVKSSPDDKGVDLFVIHEGIKVQIIDEVGEWRQIKINDGNKGWVKVGNIEVI